MKKTYISPSINIYKIKASKLLNGSPDSVYETTAGQGSKESPANLSREFGFGDEE